MAKHGPITKRFTRYSDADQRADALWDRYKQLENWQSHGGALLHEQPPHIQRLVYDFSRAMFLASKQIVPTLGALPCSRHDIPEEVI